VADNRWANPSQLIHSQAVRTFAPLVVPMAAVLLVLILVVLHDEIDWGTFPEWIAAGATVGVLAVAVALLRQSQAERRAAHGEEPRPPAGPAENP
jgi:hypothetical protein